MSLMLLTLLAVVLTPLVIVLCVLIYATWSLS